MRYAGFPLALLLASSVPAFAQSARAPLPAGAQPGDAVTYHFDNLRTGWNSAETVLTPASVQSGAFGLIKQVPLDEQVDAQPLYIGQQKITGRGTHNVVIVVTENDSVYAIDAATGKILIQRNLGTPVPQSALPGQCDNNSANVGIISTPVIDRTAGLIYVMAYTNDPSGPAWRLHALNLTDLTDAQTPVLVSASVASGNGKTFTFDPAHARQRSALLETGGNIYAGFASWCDIDADKSRGWVLGWNAATLQPLPSSILMNQRPKSPDTFFLSSVWMSGYGISSDDNGNLFVATGNSDPSGTTYSQKYNLAESVVKLSSDLTTVEDFFTLAGQNGWKGWDMQDNDLGSGGVLLLPQQPGGTPNLAVAAGKVGPMFLLNRDHLGGLGSTRLTVGTYQNDGCWCGQSYYVGADGIGRVVSSTGQTVRVYTVSPQQSKTVLQQESASQPITSGQDPGFFTTISSNGTQAGTALIWSLGRPIDFNPGQVTLYAMDPSQGASQIFSAPAGTWPFGTDANANLVPLAANGHVYVASYKNLSIFGLTSGTQQTFQAPPAPPQLAQTGGHVLHGTVTTLGKDTLTLRLRNGQMVNVNFASADKAYQVAPPSVGHASLIRGTYNPSGTLVATTILHAKDSPALWRPDR